MILLVLALASLPPEELALRTTLHRLELRQFAAWKAEREDDEEYERKVHNALEGQP